MTMKPFLKKNNKGFTIAEVVLALVIMALILPTLFMIVNVIVRSSPLIHDSRTRNSQVRGYIDLCRNTLLNLPPTSFVRGGIEEINSNSFPTLKIINPPDSLLVGNRTASAEELHFTVRPRQGGGYHAGILILLPSEEVDADEEEEKWLPLVTDVFDMEWSYYDANTQNWNDRWVNSARRPSLIELIFTPMESENSLSTVFWIPASRTAEQNSLVAEEQEEPVDDVSVPEDTGANVNPENTPQN